MSFVKGSRVTRGGSQEEDVVATGEVECNYQENFGQDLVGGADEADKE